MSKVKIQFILVFSISFGLLSIIYNLLGAPLVSVEASQEMDISGKSVPLYQQQISRPGAAIITLSPSKDNTFYNPGDDLSNGSGPYMFVGRTGFAGGNRVLRTVIAFDIAGNIPPNATIESARLIVNASKTGGGPKNVSLHRLSADWGEAGSDAGVPSPGSGIWDDAEPGDATWAYRFYTTTTWTTPGGDFSNTASAATPVGGPGSYTWGSTAQMIADVQGWLDDPGANFGWLLKMDDEVSTQTAKRFDSRNHPQSNVQPQLVIEYSLPGPNLTLSKSVSNPMPSNAGERITYTLIISNSGTGQAMGAFVTDNLATGLTFAGPISLDPPGAGTVGTPPTIASGLTINAGQQITLTVPVSVNTGLLSGTQIINTAAISSPQLLDSATDTSIITIVGVPELVTIDLVKDNTLYEISTGSLSNGAGEFLFAGRTNQAPGLSIRRGVIAFDIAANIPPTATIVSAKLRLTLTAAGSDDLQPVELRRLLADWGEGTSDAPGSEGSGAPAVISDATWTHAFTPTTAWATVGGDFASSASASAQVGGSGTVNLPYEWGSTSGMVADVQHWLDNPTANFGWLLLGNENAAETVRSFASRENSIEPNRPVLIIEYQLSAPRYEVFLPTVLK